MKIPTLLALTLASLSLPVFAADLTVSAAASLTDAFTDIAKQYERSHPNTHIRLNFAGSGALLQQIKQGAPVDIFASADELRMDQAAQSGLIDTQTRRDFAANALVAIVPIANQTQYPDLSAFIHAQEIKQLAIANPEHVPAGRYTKIALDSAHLWQQVTPKNIPATNVRQALDYVARGEVDGGFVYQTDAALMPDKVRIALHVPLQTPLTYPVAVLKNSTEPKAAKAFIDYITTGAGKAVLTRYGFAIPTQQQTQPSCLKC